ncbi:hypothetical protein VII00023_18509 [Vibrio ichthyoenteri ATCC 700023]|uniref:Peptidase S1 domain-containing protein n=1 Tax=Vibrio ichthyoenteri ATCC 700023 TaxID=870968 RepID=F9S3P0_9VIBR|nr:trypsin-like serine protease [Vibrio ichthyoenteri]EGU37811.1 hypothetical protein VII00023_18509 [Vibrio ichthyoenteri ATCC 700023]
MRTESFNQAGKVNQTNHHKYDYNPNSVLERSIVSVGSVLCLPIALGLKLADSCSNQTIKMISLLAALSPASAIAFGRDVTNNRTPTVYIEGMTHPDGRGYQCTGVALKPNVILTANHCTLNNTLVEEYYDIPCDTDNPTSDGGDFYDECGEGAGYRSYQRVNNMPPESLKVFHFLSKENPEMLDVESIYRLDGFNLDDKKTARNDLAIIKLKKPINDVDFAKLPSKKQHLEMRDNFAEKDNPWIEFDKKRKHYENKMLKYQQSKDTMSEPKPPRFPQNKNPNVRVEGWGNQKDLSIKPNLTESGNIPFGFSNQVDSTNLQEAEMTARNRQDPRSILRGKYNDCSDSLICTSSLSLKNEPAVCDGDSGGPMYLISGKKRPILVGIASNANCETESTHVDIYQHKKWIREHI